MKLSNLIDGMDNLIIEFISRHGLDNYGLGGVYDFIGQCAIFYDATNPQDRKKHMAFKAIMSSTSDLRDGTLIWSWGNKHLPENIQEETFVLREYGKKNKIPEFAERCIIVDPRESRMSSVSKKVRESRSFNDGLNSLKMHRMGEFYSRLNSRELFAIITKLLGAKMSASLPVIGTTMNTNIFITDPTILKDYEVSDATRQLLSLY
tara:strand:- start:481 stop:1098 length:618 start_codon:yes stop_codon:yes gene_type:complete